MRQAISGRGSVVFIVGEPGLGKSRLVRECRERFMAWVGAGTGRLPLWLEGRSASFGSSTPYGLYQQLLSAWIGVAPDEAEQVVGPTLQRAMKAVFGGDTEHVPFLAQMMGISTSWQGSPITRLSPEGLQRATFASVRALIEHLAAKLPDRPGPGGLTLGGPDFPPAYSEDCNTYPRGAFSAACDAPPEPDQGVSELETALEKDSACVFRRVELAPLAEGAERELAGSILGRQAPEDVVLTLRSRVDGNPLFLEERFLSLVQTGALVQKGDSWSLSGNAPKDVLPDVLERLIRSRVDRLSAPAREAIIAASVLGPEFSLSALRAVSEMEDELPASMAELCSTGLVVERHQRPEPVFRFRHALVQEATYASLLHSRRSQLHARAAWALEEASYGRLQEVAAVVGHHYAMAEDTERAVHHLSVAAKHAAAHSAIDEAVSSYREALETIGQAAASAPWVDTAVELRAELAAVLWRNYRLVEARGALLEALAIIRADKPLQAACLQARLGRVQVDYGYQAPGGYSYEPAIAAFDAADQLLGDEPEQRGQEWAEAWLEVQIDGRANLYNWRNQPDLAAAVLDRATPVVEKFGSTSRKAGFYLQLSIARCNSSSQVDDASLAIMRRAVQAAEGGEGEHELAYCVGTLGCLLMYRGELDEAEAMMRSASALASRLGDPLCRSWSLCLLSRLGVRRHDVEAVRSLSHQARAAAISANLTWWVAAATAAMAWVAWKDSCFSEVVGLADEALELWDGSAFTSPTYTANHKGLCLWPLMSVRLDAGQTAEAVDAGRLLLEPSLVRPLDQAESLLDAALRTWEGGDWYAAAGKLSKALGRASALGHC